LVADTTGVYELSLSPPMLRLDRVGNQIVLSWTNAAYALQSGPVVTGPFFTILGASSPYTNAVSGSQRFYRLAK